MKVIKDLECIIMSCEEPTYYYCLESVRAQTYSPNRIARIENVSPLSDSINQRHQIMELKYSVKVDADMFLYENCFESLYNALKENNGRYYAATGMLLDPFIGKMGAVHMEKTKLVQHILVEDVIGCDRFVREKMKKKGYTILELDEIVGEHWCDWSDEAIFKRHVRVGQKHFYYRDKHHEDWVKSIGKKWIKENSNAAFLALMGYCYGLLTPDASEKDFTFMGEEWPAIVELMEDKVIPKVKDLWSLRGDE